MIEFSTILVHPSSESESRLIRVEGHMEVEASFLLNGLPTYQLITIVFASLVDFSL